LAKEPQEQAPDASKPAAPVAPAAPEKIILKEGADVDLKFAQDLSSENSER
jgi:hypothetical protein